jgi:hypothetical protein
MRWYLRPAVRCFATGLRSTPYFMTTTDTSPAIAMANPSSADVSQRLNSVAWIPGRDLHHGEWTAIGKRLGGLVRCSQWWIGDWVRYGSARWGERYIVAARITGYDVDSLRNMVWISSRFHPSRRRNDLTWSHHASLATLEPDEQDVWLDRAIEERLSVADLRIELRAARRGDRGLAADGRGLQGDRKVDGITCPRCGLEIDPAEKHASPQGNSDSHGRAHDAEARDYAVEGSTR